MSRYIVTAPDSISLKKFTSGEANRCRVLKFERTNDNDISEFAYWKVEVQDELGVIYKWNDFDTAPSDNVATIRANIIAHLTNNVDRQLFPVNTSAAAGGTSASAAVGKYLDGTTPL